MIPGLINLIIWLLIVGILVALAFWVLTQIPGIPAPIVQIIRVVITVVVVLVIVMLLLQLVGGGPGLPKLAWAECSQRLVT
jgi:hypothetical protein